VTRGMGRTVSAAPGYAPDDEFDPLIDDFQSSERLYRHFDLPLSETERQGFSVTQERIRTNSFWPLIGYSTKERRAIKNSDGVLSFEDKERPIRFGSHKDAAILEYYSKHLSKLYDRTLKDLGISSSVLAYRSGVGNNIIQSKNLFDEICARDECTALAMDIKGFFDNIRHVVLFQNLLRVKGVERLSDADFSVFKRMSKFEWVETKELKERLGKHYGRAGRICSSSEFRDKVRGNHNSLIRTNEKEFGIPQGTPLSGLYANISMLHFDEVVSKLVLSLGGSYRRYSDDLAFLLPKAVQIEMVLGEITCRLAEIGLDISPKKTDISVFSRVDGELRSDKPFQYLGFTFDGQYTLIRQSSINKYYRKMTRGTRGKIWAAKRNKVPSDQIFMRDLFKKYTHFGRTRNFPRYAYRASAVHSSPEIRRQIRRHMTIFKLKVRESIDAIYYPSDARLP